MVDLLDGAEAMRVGQPAGEVDYVEEIRGEGWHARRSVMGGAVRMPRAREGEGG